MPSYLFVNPLGEDSEGVDHRDGRGEIRGHRLYRQLVHQVINLNHDKTWKERMDVREEVATDMLPHLKTIKVISDLSAHSYAYNYGYSIIFIYKLKYI